MACALPSPCSHWHCVKSGATTRRRWKVTASKVLAHRMGGDKSATWQMYPCHVIEGEDLAVTCQDGGLGPLMYERYCCWRCPEAFFSYIGRPNRPPSHGTASHTPISTTYASTAVNHVDGQHVRCCNFPTPLSCGSKFHTVPVAAWGEKPTCHI